VIARTVQSDGTHRRGKLEAPGTVSASHPQDEASGGLSRTAFREGSSRGPWTLVFSHFYPQPGEPVPPGLVQGSQGRGDILQTPHELSNKLKCWTVYVLSLGHEGSRRPYQSFNISG